MGSIQMDEINSRIDLILQRINGIEADVEQKIYTVEFDKIKVLIEKLPTIVEVNKWKKDLNTEITDFQKQNEQFKFEFKIQNEIIRRYDEVLNTKASKVALQLVNSDVDRLIDEKLKKSKDEFESMNNSIKL